VPTYPVPAGQTVNLLGVSMVVAASLN